MLTKTAIISGSSSGIGAATALTFAKHGINVVVTYLSNEQGAKAVATQCEAFGVGVLVGQLDVANDENCIAVIDSAKAHFGEISYLINNAAKTKFIDFSALEDLNHDDFNEIYQTNVIGAYQLSRRFYKLASHGTAIVNVSSIAGIRGVGSSIAYATSKGALNTLTLCLARTLSPKVRVNAVAPGFVDSGWWDKCSGFDKAQAADHHRHSSPLNTIVHPSDVADMIYSLACNEKITGQILTIDAGDHL